MEIRWCKIAMSKREVRVGVISWNEMWMLMRVEVVTKRF
jgi:hypothetical protein